MDAEFDRAALVSIFVAEATDGLTKLWTALNPADAPIPTQETIQPHYVVAHTIKGIAAMYDFMGVVSLADALEPVLEHATRASTTEWPDVVAMLRDTTGTLRAQIEAIGRLGAEDQSAIEAWKTRYSHMKPTYPTCATDGPPDESLSASYLNPDLDPEVISYFAPEAQEYVDAIEASLLRLEKNPQDPNTIQQLFRTAHTLKGSAYTVGFRAIGDLTHHVEDYIGVIRDGHRQMMPGMMDLFFRAIDVVRQLMRRDRSTLDKTRREFSAVMQGLQEMSGAPPSGGRAAPEEKAAFAPIQIEPSDRQMVGSQQASVSQKAEEEAGRRQDADRQQGTEPKPVAEGAVIRVSRDRLERLLNLVGELVIGRGRLEQRLMVLEHLSHQVQVYKNRLQESVRTFEEQHAFTLPPASPNMGEASDPRFPGLTDFSSLEFDKYDDFNVFARRTAEVSSDINEAMSQLSNSIKRAREDMDQFQRLTLGMRDEIARARMVPIGTPFTRFRRAVREMARTTGKDVTLITSGEQTEVDTGVVERLVDPLIHLVRNAVYHGIEPSAVRIAQGERADPSHLCLLLRTRRERDRDQRAAKE